MFRIRTALTAALLCLASAAPARAGYQFQFAAANGTAANSFTVDAAVQNFVDVRVYLVGTGGDAATLQNTGLESYGVKLTWGAGAAAQVVSDSHVTGSAAFDGGTFTSATATSASANGVVGFSPTTAAKAGADGRIYLATFRFTGLTNGDVVTLTADPDPTLGSADTVLAGGSAIDALISNSSATITVQNVPEPGTLVLGGLLATAVAGGAVRRRRAGAA